MRFKAYVTATGVIVILAAFLAAPALAQPAAVPAPQTKPVCANCHEDKWHSIDLSAHGARNDASGSMCQACHGDASEHLKDPLKAKPANPFAKGKPAGEQA